MPKLIDLSMPVHNDMISFPRVVRPALVMYETWQQFAERVGAAKYGVDWLTAHTHVTQAVVAVVEPGTSSMMLVAEHGVTASAIMDFSLTRDDDAHPLIQAMRHADPTFFESTNDGFRPPIEDSAFHAIPLRTDDDSLAPAGCV